MTKVNLVPALPCAAAIAGPAVVCAQSSPAAWSATTSYQVGDLAQYNHNIYRSIYPNHNNNPTTSFSDWELYNARFTLTLNMEWGNLFPTS